MELQQLKEIADKLNITYHHLIGAEKLETNIRNYCEDNGLNFDDLVNQDEQPNDTNTDTFVDTDVHKPVQTKFDVDLSTATFSSLDKAVNDTESSERLKDALKLIRCTITCNNTNKISYTGEIFCARNEVISEIKKMIPFGVPTHVPSIMLNMIKEKQCQIFTVEKVNGMPVTKSSLMPEYNIQILPPITSEELSAIKQKQLAEGFKGE